MKRAQIGVEALIAIGIVFLILLTTYALYSVKQTELTRSNKALAEYNDCLTVSEALTNAYLLGPGSEITVRTNTELTYYPNAQRIESERSLCTTTIRAGNDTQVLNPGTVRIVHDGNGVSVNA